MSRARARCPKCGRFAMRSIIRTICHPCIAAEQGMTYKEWIAAQREASERAVEEWDRLTQGERLAYLNR